jgi:hypothetical protein
MAGETFETGVLSKSKGHFERRRRLRRHSDARGKTVLGVFPVY